MKYILRYIFLIALLLGCESALAAGVRAVMYWSGTNTIAAPSNFMAANIIAGTNIVLTGGTNAPLAVNADMAGITNGLASLDGQNNFTDSNYFGSNVTFGADILTTNILDRGWLQVDGNQTNLGNLVVDGELIEAVNVLNFGALGDGVTDDSAAFYAAMAVGKPVIVPYKTTSYVVTNLHVTNSLIGVRGVPKLEFLWGETGFMLDTLTNHYVQIRNLELDGGSNVVFTGKGGPGPLLRSAINAYGYGQNSKIDNVWIHGFDNYGIRISGVGAPRLTNNLSVINVTSENCYIGFDSIESVAEYVSFTSIRARGCRYGFRSQAGNQTLVSSIFNDCGYGVDIYSGANNGHGTIIGCLMNHCLYPLQIVSASAGMSVFGCNMFDGILYLASAGNVYIQGCTLDIDEFRFESGYRNWIVGNTIGQSYANVITHDYNNPDDTRMYGNFRRDGTPYGDAGWLITGGMLIETNSLATIPTTPRHHGDLFTYNSNGVPYVISSVPGTLQWATTNRGIAYGSLEASNITDNGWLQVDGGLTNTGGATLTGNTLIGTGAIATNMEMYASTGSNALTLHSNLVVRRMIYSSEAVGGSTNLGFIFDVTNAPGWIWSDTVYSFRIGGQEKLKIQQGGAITTGSSGIISATSTTPESGNNCITAHGMRRTNPFAGFNFAFGESISTSEPGMDIFPVGGTLTTGGTIARFCNTSARNPIVEIGDYGAVIYGAYASGGADYERLEVDYDATRASFRIEASASGAGTDRPIIFMSGGNTNLILDTSGGATLTGTTRIGAGGFATNLVNQWTTTPVAGVVIDASVGRGIFITNADYTITGFANLASGVGNMVSLVVSNSAATAISVTGSPTTFLIGASTSDPVSIPAGKVAYFSWDIWTRTNMINAVEQ